MANALHFTKLWTICELFNLLLIFVLRSGRIESRKGRQAKAQTEYITTETNRQKEVHNMSKKSYKNANSRLSKAWSKVEAVHDREGFYVGEKYTPAKKPLTGRQMNRILYQEGLYWKLRWYGRGWTTNQMPYLYPTHRYVIREDFGFIRVQQVK